MLIRYVCKSKLANAITSNIKLIKTPNILYIKVELKNINVEIINSKAGIKSINILNIYFFKLSLI